MISVGIDVSKEKSTVCILKPNEDFVCKPFELLHNKEDLELLNELLQKLDGEVKAIHPFEDGNGRTARLLSGYIMDVNGYGFNGIGSLEEYFAYDVNEYYESIQMGLPALYYSGRNEPPHPEKWVEYFLRMVSLYSEKVREIAGKSIDSTVVDCLSHLKWQDRDFLLYLMDHFDGTFTTMEVSRIIGLSNRMVINRLSNLAKNGFVIPHLVNERIMSYELSDFTKENTDTIRERLERSVPRSEK